MKDFKELKNPALSYINVIPQPPAGGPADPAAHQEDPAPEIQEVPTQDGNQDALPAWMTKKKQEMKSKRMQILVRPSTYDMIQKAANASGLSMNEIVNEILEWALKGANNE